MVRAYSSALNTALENAEFIKKKKGFKVKIQTEYDELEQFKYNANKCNFKIQKIEYLDKVELILEVLEEDIEKITNNGNKNLFKILKYDILEEKYIDI